MKLILKINGLKVNELNFLLARINLIKDKIYPELEVDYSYLTNNPNWISINQTVNDMDKALTLFKLLNNLNYIRDTNNNPVIVSFDICLTNSMEI